MNSLSLALRSPSDNDPTSRALSDLARWLVIGLMVVAAVAHIPVIGPHMQEARYMGVLFILFTIAALATAIALAVRPTPLLYAFAAALCIAAVCTYVATRLIAFPMLSDDVGMWGEPLGIVSITTESAAALIALTQVRFTSRQPAKHVRRAGQPRATA
jgi:FtsH-binding integral membrane protein